MNRLFEEYRERRVGSIFLYTHEAHPGEHYPPHDSMDRKYAHAADLRDIYKVSRPILLDSIDGACHRAFGSMPNMTWIFDVRGVPVYKADWTDSESVRNALEFFTRVPERRRSGERLTPFNVQRLDYRNQERDQFYRNLGRAGPRAVEEFKKAFPDG